MVVRHGNAVNAVSYDAGQTLVLAPRAHAALQKLCDAGRSLTVSAAAPAAPPAAAAGGERDRQTRRLLNQPPRLLLRQPPPPMLLNEYLEARETLRVARDPMLESLFRKTISLPPSAS